MSEESAEITALKRTRWRTAISGRIERFSTLLDNKTIASRYFGEKFVELLTQKITRIWRVLLALSIAYAILMLSLFAAQDSKKAEFEIFGYGFKNLGYHKEIILLLAVSISPISAILSGYHRYLVAMRDECLKRIVPPAEVREFYSNALIDNYFDPLVRKYDYRTSSPHVATSTLAFFLVSVMSLVGLTLLAGSFLLQLYVIYDVATNPSTSRIVNLGVVGYSITSILLAWTISFMQLPLPEIDPSNLHRLTEMQASDPEKYKRTMESMARDSSRREDAWSLSLGFVASIVTVASLVPLLGKATHLTINNQFSHGLMAVFAALLVARPIADTIRRLAMNWFFRRYPEGVEDRLRVFSWVKRFILAACIVAPSLIAASVLIAQFAHW